MAQEQFQEQQLSMGQYDEELNQSYNVNKPVTLKHTLIYRI